MRMPALFAAVDEILAVAATEESHQMDVLPPAAGRPCRRPSGVMPFPAHSTMNSWGKGTCRTSRVIRKRDIAGAASTARAHVFALDVLADAVPKVNGRRKLFTPRTWPPGHPDQRLFPPEHWPTPFRLSSTPRDGWETDGGIKIDDQAPWRRALGLGRAREPEKTSPDPLRLPAISTEVFRAADVPVQPGVFVFLRQSPPLLR